MRTMRNYGMLLLLIGLFFMMSIKSGNAQDAKRHPFNIYGFIVYAGYIKQGVKQQNSMSQLQNYLQSIGIGKYNLIYEHKVLDYPNGDKKNGTINLNRMDSLAALAVNEPTGLVSLDLEGWNRFDTSRTVHRMLDAIKSFRRINKVSPLGFYATVPQDTYGFPKDQQLYERLNKAYRPVAAVVDYYSPSLYNYKGVDSLDWYKAAVFNLEACHKYSFSGKQILPYITPEVWNGDQTTFLTYEQMWYRLKVLYDLGADGCLLWTSSKTRNPDGTKIFVDENAGWLKAVKDFIKQYPSSNH
ncbi:hypothetical protein [Mucilaginibacter sp. PAMB04168]|uniref:hypothetical protein n=1 Tax=Mucilaginibacter sp. PAMB04168 TaxID=3138567 RepID=UPI0031F689BB